MCAQSMHWHSHTHRACVRSFSYTHRAISLSNGLRLLYAMLQERNRRARIKRILRYTYYLVEKGEERASKERATLDFKVLNSNFGDCWKAKHRKQLQRHAHFPPFWTINRCRRHSYSHYSVHLSYIGAACFARLFSLYFIFHLIAGRWLWVNFSTLDESISSMNFMQSANCYRWQIWFESVVFCQCYHLHRRHSNNE